MSALVKGLGIVTVLLFIVMVVMIVMYTQTVYQITSNKQAIAGMLEQIKTTPVTDPMYVKRQTAVATGTTQVAILESRRDERKTRMYISIGLFVVLFIITMGLMVMGMKKSLESNEIKSV